ncbi:MAG: hypothetical protein KBE04_13115, partial [Phycisphaerae bacterium]|nr:hypothetical protein [Phycisphaerae bacterium]
MLRIALSLVSLLLVLAATSVVAAEVLYYDNFDGPANVDLSGTTPDVTTDASPWQAGTWIKANGSFGGGSSGQMFTAALPFLPVTGAAYELSATVDNAGDWVGIAFLSAAPNVSTRINDNGPLLWSLTRPSGASAKDQAFVGPGTGGGLGNTTTTSAAELKVRIEMNSETDWLVRWFFDGSQEFQRTVNPSTSGMALRYVGFGSNGLFSACTGTIRSFKLVEIPQALKPSPANGSLVYTTDVVLQWQPGIYAGPHDVYLGTRFEDVNSATPSTPAVYQGRQDPNHCAASALTPGLTYYWRIDEIRSDGVTIDKGEVWRFTVQPLTAYGPSPAHEAKYMDSGVDLAWSAGAKATSHDVYLGTSLEAVSNAKSTDPMGPGHVYRARQSGTTYDPGVLSLGTDYYWRIDEVSGKDIWTGAVWRFSTLPVLSVTDPNLQGWWTFDEGQGVTAVDWSGHGRHGTLVNGPQWSAAGQIGGALQFDGLDDQVSLPVGSVLSALNSATFTVWVNWARVGATVQRIFDVGTGAEAYMYLSPGNGGGGGSILFTITNTGAAGESQLSSSGGLAAGWHHMAVVMDGAGQEMRLYVDDELIDADTTQVLPADLGVTTQNWLGRSQAGDYTWFIGFLDDFRIYDKALTQGEIGRVMEGDPRFAWDPSPANGRLTDSREALPLTWSAGDGATAHAVYLGTDANAVVRATPSDTTGIYRGQQAGTAYTPPEGVAWGQTYTWRVDELQGDGTAIQGKPWTFSVADYFIADDFEAYDDECNRVFFSWLGGAADSGSTNPACPRPEYGGNGTGSEVGNFNPPFAEQTIVHSGEQAIPVWYDNSQSPFYSEMAREWTVAQSWTDDGVNALRVYLRGDPPAFLEQADGTILMNGTGADIWGNADQFRFAYKPLKGNGSIVAKVEAVTNVNSNAKAGVMIRETLNQDSMHALVNVTPGAGVEFIRRVVAVGESTATGQAGAAAPCWVKLTRAGNLFTAQWSADGVTWAGVGEDPAASTVEIPMGQDVYIGL